MRVPREVCGRGIADAGREPYPIVLEKAPLAGREVVEPGRDVVEEELPRVCAFGGPIAERVRGPCFFDSAALVGFVRVAV